MGGREREEKKNWVLAGFCGLEWSDSRARVVEESLEPNKPRRPVWWRQGKGGKKQESLAKPLNQIEVTPFKTLSFSIQVLIEKFKCISNEFVRA